MMPDVFGTIWKDVEEVATAVVLANAANEPRTVRFKAVAKDLALQNLVGFANAAMENVDGVVSLTLPPRGFAFLKTPQRKQ